MTLDIIGDSHKAKFVFFGTPEFAAIVLQKLIDAGMPPLAVVCNPDRPAGRKKIITPPPVKSLAIEHGAQNIKILQPEKLEIGNWSLELGKIGEADFAVVASYGKIIPQEIIDSFPRGIIGVHPSLLPKYRGASPIQSAILNGEEKTGVTLYMLDEKMDHGPVLASRELEFPISNFQFSNLLRKLAELGGNMFAEILPKFARGEVKPQPQNEAEATYTKKFSSEDAFVPPADLEAALSGKNPAEAELLERKIRALNPEPGVWTRMSDKRPRAASPRTKRSFYGASQRGKQATPSSFATGQASDKEMTGKRVKLLEAEIQDGKLVLKKTQLEGEKPKNV